MIYWRRGVTSGGIRSRSCEGRRMAFELLKYSDEQALAKAAAGEWLRELQAFTQTQQGNDRSYSVALSGGRIARNFFEEILRQAHASPDSGQTLFANAHFFWADER